MMIANLFYTILIGIFFDYKYKDDHDLRYYSKFALYSGLFFGGMSFYADIMRQAFQSRSLYVIIFIIELVLFLYLWL